MTTPTPDVGYDAELDRLREQVAACPLRRAGHLCCDCDPVAELERMTDERNIAVNAAASKIPDFDVQAIRVACDQRDAANRRLWEVEAQVADLRAAVARARSVVEEARQHSMRGERTAVSDLGLNVLAALATPAREAPADLKSADAQPIGNATSLGPCTSICDAASYGDGPRSGCFTPWCKCECHHRAYAARAAEKRTP